MTQAFEFTRPASVGNDSDLTEEDRADLQRLRELCPRIHQWSDDELADAWSDFSRDLRGLSWYDPLQLEPGDLLAFLMVRKLFPEIDAHAVGYEAFRSLGVVEPRARWPQVTWPSWVLSSNI
jgi:hypothetical protein